MNTKNPFEGLDDISPDSPQPANPQPTPPPATSSSHPGAIKLGPPPQQPWQPSHPAAPQDAAPAMRRKRAPIGLIVGLVFGLGLLGGGYFAYAKGYVSLPFLPVVPDRMLAKLVGAGEDLRQAQYTLAVEAATEARDPKIKALTLDDSRAPGSLGIVGLDTSNDMTFNGLVSMYYEYDQPLKSSDAFLKIQGSTGGSAADSFALELRKVGLNLFGQVTQLPESLKEYLKPETFLNTWIRLADEETIETFIELQESNLSKGDLENLTLQQQLDLLQDMTEAATKTKVMKSVKRIGRESIGGAATDRYRFQIDSRKIEPFLREFGTVLKNHGQDSAPIDQMLDELNGTNGQSLKKFFEVAVFDLWAEKDSGLMRQFVTSVYLAPDDLRQVKLTVRMTLDAHNQVVDVPAPTEFRELDDITNELFGLTTPTGSFGSPAGSVLDQYGLAACYVNAHPDVIAQMPKNDLTESWRDYIEADAADIGCSDYALADIEASKTLLITDADGDGLTLIAERFFGSNDSKKDTDGDGYDDYIEVENGYNPNGSGSLEAELPTL